MDPGLRRDDIVGVEGPVPLCLSCGMGKVFIVYMLASMKGGTVYTGVSGNPAGRIWQHKNHVDPKGFTARHKVTRLVWYEVHEDAMAAIQREKRIKEWQRTWKVRLIKETNPTWRDLSHEIEDWF
jgi:putative endonuclease